MKSDINGVLTAVYIYLNSEYKCIILTERTFYEH